VKSFFALLAFSAGFGMQAEFNHFNNCKSRLAGSSPCVLSIEADLVLEHPTVFEFNAVNKLTLLGSARYPLLKVIWLLVGIVADLLICCSLCLDLQR